MESESKTAVGPEDVLEMYVVYHDLIAVVVLEAEVDAGEEVGDCGSGRGGTGEGGWIGIMCGGERGGEGLGWDLGWA